MENIRSADKAGQEIRKEVQRELEGRLDIDDEEVLRLIDEKIRLKNKQVSLGLSDKLAIRREVFNAMRRLDVLQELIDDPGITEIMVNGMHSIFIERDGRLYDTGRRFDSKTADSRGSEPYGERGLSDSGCKA